MQAVLTGVGRSAVGRALGRDPLDLAIDATTAAIADAGLQLSDIDGIAAFIPDSGSASVTDVQAALGLEVDWYVGTVEGPSQLEALWSACAAVEAGRARHVLVFHSSSEGTVRTAAGRGGSLPGTARAMPARATGPQAWWLPFGAPSAVNVFALYAQRHFHQYGTTREQLAQIALVQRANAARYAESVYDAPLTMDDYLSARMISDPLCLLDCDVPVDFSTAVIVSRDDSTYGLRRSPIRIEALSTQRPSWPTWSQNPDIAVLPAQVDVGRDLWRRTTLTPADVDVAAIYDGFSFLALMWLEALGFCEIGEGGAYLEGGKRIALDGELPINPHGGQLSSGRMHGWGYVPEMCTQLWGEGGERQVAGSPEVALVACGGGVGVSAALLTRS